MSNTRLWGEFEDKFEDQYAYLPKVNFSQLIEVSLNSDNFNAWSSGQQQQGALVGLPLDSVTLGAAILSHHARLYDEGTHHPTPQTTNHIEQHPPNVPLRHIDKEYCNWSKGSSGPWLGRASSGDCKRALMQACALELATHPPSISISTSALETMADAAHHFLLHLTQTMRDIADREASDKPSGFPDLMSKVFTELGINNLHEWYNDRVLGAKQRALSRCKQAQEEVPQIHFPASLEALGEASLGPGYRMLHSLENDHLLPMLELDDPVQDGSTTT